MGEKIQIGSNKSFGIVFFIVFFLISLYPLTNDGSLNLWSLIITFIFHTLSLSSQIVNVDSKRQSEEKGLSGITEFTFDFNKSVQTDWEFSNITYLQWDNEKWSVLLLNETNLDRAAGIDFSNDGYQHLRISKHLNKIYTIESYLQNQYDPVRDIKNRKLAGLGVRLKFIKSCVLGLSTFYEKEEITNETINDIRISSSFQIKFDFGKKLSLSTTTYYQPSTKNLKDSKSSNETILLINLNERLSISNTLSTNYDTNPAKDIPNLIYSFENGVVYSF